MRLSVSPNPLQLEARRNVRNIARIQKVKWWTFYWVLQDFIGGKEEKWLYYEVASAMRDVGIHDVCENFVELLKSYGTLLSDDVISQTGSQLKMEKQANMIFSSKECFDFFLKYILYHKI